MCIMSCVRWNKCTAYSVLQNIAYAAFLHPYSHENDPSRHKKLRDDQEFWWWLWYSHCAGWWDDPNNFLQSNYCHDCCYDGWHIVKAIRWAQSAELYRILGMEWCWLTQRWVSSLRAQLYCSARGISDGWCNGDGPVGMLRLQMDKYFRGDDIEISFHCLMDGWRNMRMRHCVCSCTLRFIVLLILWKGLPLIYWIVWFGHLELRPHEHNSSYVMRFHHSWCTFDI